MPQQLDKILALADSSHENEAVVAVRKARQILEKDGLSFSDLAKAVSAGAYVKSPGVFNFLSGGREVMQAQIQKLRTQVSDLQGQAQVQETQLDFWKRRVVELEQCAVHAQTEAERWKKLASETADRLWEIAKTMGGEEPHNAKKAEHKTGRKKQ